MARFGKLVHSSGLARSESLALSEGVARSLSFGAVLAASSTMTRLHDLVLSRGHDSLAWLGALEDRDCVPPASGPGWRGRPVAGRTPGDYSAFLLSRPWKPRARESAARTREEIALKRTLHRERKSGRKSSPDAI